jgi:CheY-like chemotaxis protein
MSSIIRFSLIRALIITGSQNRDEEFLGLLHKVGLQTSVTTFQKNTVSQVKANLSNPTDRFKLIIIMDDEDFDGFDAARALFNAGLSKEFIVFMVSSNDRKGNFLKCLTMGVDLYLVKPFDTNELIDTLSSSFTYIESTVLSDDLQQPAKELSLLVVEDNKMNQIIITKMLASLGYSVEIADDGYEGFMKAKSRKYDLIFMDLIMPEMDGYESTRRIMDYDRSNIIVAFTADNMPETRKKAELSGIKEFISKPVRIEDLRRLFAKYFSV